MNRVWVVEHLARTPWPVRVAIRRAEAFAMMRSLRALNPDDRFRVRAYDAPPMSAAARRRAAQ